MVPTMLNTVIFSFKNKTPITAPTTIAPPIIIGIPVEAGTPLPNTRKERISAPPTQSPANME